MRVIRSTVQGPDIDPDLEEAFEDAIAKADNQSGILRETYSLDSIRQKEWHHRIITYTDPTGQQQFAVLQDDPAEVDWQDTRDYDEAVAMYEEGVRATAESSGPTIKEREDEETGRMVEVEVPPFDFTDVPGVDGYEDGAEESGNATALLIVAEWADAEAEEAQRAAAEKTRARQIAYARAIDAFGRGGNAVLAGRVGLKEPTVKAIADKGRALLREQAEMQDDRPASTS